MRSTLSHQWCASDPYSRVQAKRILTFPFFSKTASKRVNFGLRFGDHTKSTCTKAVPAQACARLYRRSPGPTASRHSLARFIDREQQFEHNCCSSSYYIPEMVFDHCTFFKTCSSKHRIGQCQEHLVDDLTRLGPSLGK